MSEELVTSLDRDADVVTVRLHGEVDVLNVDRVRVCLVEALESRPGTVVVDLAELSFIDSTGLGAIIFGFQRARDQGVEFRLARPSRGVRQILVLSGVLEVITLTE
ncbi:STAS domain-containing protein [Actinoplanes auranticolor]|uniref:Anti-sigma factor antagonist n=1 Tax=Actinoplanes auranticolor TaxID=47988 RepID=A0A919SQ76_9ACTN|nr:STAS domain-containing protein [Actinoplanes auranticolor]GIM75542.1 anti-sigma-B factor antagonist [Actinoplanes auranticolor]